MRKKTMRREDEEIHYGVWLLACLLNLNTSKICVVHLMEQFPGVRLLHMEGIWH